MTGKRASAPKGGRTAMTVSVSGFVAYLLLYASVVTGTSLSSPFLRKRLPMSARAGRGHELLSLGGLLAAGVHAIESVIPLRENRILMLGVMGPRGPLSPGLALGVAGLYALILATAAVYLRRRLGPSLWRALHSLAYPAFATVSWHTAAVGANAWLPLVRLVYLVTLGSAGLLAGARLLEAALHPDGIVARARALIRTSSHPLR